MSGIHSNAFNFMSFIRGDVDPRTGMYTFGISLSALSGNALAGPALPISLGFNSLQTENLGFGIGWSLQLSCYQPATRKLTLSTGGRYEALMGSKSFSIKEQKLKTFNVKRRGDTLHIEHKNGLIEVLTNPGNRYNSWLPSAVHSPEGRTLTFEYSAVNGQRSLVQVKDAYQRMIRIEKNNTRADLILWPDKADKRIILRMILVNREANQIAIVLGDKWPSWRIRYHNVGDFKFINRIEAPTGGSELITYKNDGMALPPGAPTRYLPCVTAYKKIPGLGQEPITREYSYSDNNYLGYVVPNPDGPATDDNLHQVLTPYEYDSTETLVSGTGPDKKILRSTKRVYNHFHLLSLERVQQDGKVVERTTEYYQLPGRPLTEQPAHYQLPKRSVTTYFDVTAPSVRREEVTLNEFDEYGNPLRLVSPTGQVEAWEYYPIAGADGCPPDPLGFVRSLRSKTIIPAPGYAPAPTLRSCYRYHLIGSLRPDSPDFLVLDQEALYEEGKPEELLSTRRQYVTRLGDPFYGRVKRIVHTLNGFDTTTTYHYSMACDLIETSTTITGHEGLSATHTEWQNPLSGLIHKTQGEDGVEVLSDFDRLGRLIGETVAPGTPEAASKTYSYQLASQTGEHMEIKVIDALGIRSRTLKDGLDREVLREVQDLDEPLSPMRVVYSAHYDALGQLSEEIEQDWLQGRMLALTRSYEYDAWGNCCRKVGADGVALHTRNDPISLSQTQWIEGAGRTVTLHNPMGKPVSVERFDLQGQSQGKTTFVYDGLGRRVEACNALGHSTHFAYDFADRLVLSVLPDATRIRTEFAAHSLEHLPTGMWVNDYQVGAQRYDGLSRRTRITVGGRTRRFGYMGGLPTPTTQITAAHRVIAFDYQARLGHQLVQRRVIDNEQHSTRYRYDSRHAQMIRAESSDANATHSMEYYPSGKLRREIWSALGTEYEASHHYSLNGLPLDCTDVLGDTKVTRYDAFARPIEVQQGNVLTRFDYDALGRVARTEVQDTQSNRSLRTELVYDDFGREITRTLSASSSATQRLTQAYDLTDKLVRRTLQAGGHTLRDETFSYDSRARLQDYSCNGSQLPVDSHGKSILRQHFRFDALDNITEITTRFPGGENVTHCHFANIDKSQLSRLEHSHRDYRPRVQTFQYDLDGNLLNDDKNRRLVYDELGRLAGVEEIAP